MHNLSVPSHRLAVKKVRLVLYLERFMSARSEPDSLHNTCYICRFNGIDYIGLKYLSSEEKLSFDLSVAMVNYRTPNLVTDYLESLLPELQGVNSRVVIVDNNSRDNSFAIIQKWLTENF